MLNITNPEIRTLWLNSMGLASRPVGKLNVAKIIKDLGFVQIDTIQNVSRAHHHILWSRNRNYREHMLDDLLAAKETIFEHFTHDASILPLEFYPYWTRQFERLKNWYDNAKNYQKILTHADLDAIMKRIEAEGPLSTHAFDSEIKGKKKMWSRPPHKVGLDYLWYAGELATSHREKFKKYYDVPHRVIPDHIRSKSVDDGEQVNWLCNAALERMSFGSLREIREFWDATKKQEVEDWYTINKDNLVKIKYQNSNKEWIEALAPADIEDRLSKLQPLSSQIRIINPFDPAIRDRNRLSLIFGFDYKIEIFVPAAKRRWGYYVYPLLEGDKFVGRIELKADRKEGQLNVTNFWPEPHVKWGTGRNKKLTSELSRLARFVGLQNIHWNNQ